MASRTPGRRPGAGSRTPTPRPRRVAGSSGPVEPLEASAVPQARPEPEPEPERAPSPQPERQPERQSEPQPQPTASPRGRTVAVLAALIAVLLAVGVAEIVVISRHVDPQERSVGPTTAEQPVQVDELTVRSVVDQAAQAAVAIGSVTWDDYEAGVEAAASTMTEPFAETFRETKADVREQVVEQRVEVTVQVDAQGVVRAAPDEIVALVFLTQSTIAGTGPVTPRQYRATITMVRTGDGWLVAGLDAGDLLDITGDEG